MLGNLSEPVQVVISRDIDSVLTFVEILISGDNERRLQANNDDSNLLHPCQMTFSHLCPKVLPFETALARGVGRLFQL